MQPNEPLSTYVTEPSTPSTFTSQHTIPEKRRRFSRKRKRNHWATRNPDDYVCYKKMPELGYLKECRLIEQAQMGDIQARNLVWTQHTRMVLTVLNNFHCPEELISDAIQEGILGILRGIERFKIEKLNSFSTYVWYWIYQYIQRFLIGHRFPVPIPAHLYQNYLEFFLELDDHIRRCDTNAWNDLVKEFNESLFLRLDAIYHLSSATPIHSFRPNDLPDRKPIRDHEYRELRTVISKLLKCLKPRNRFVIIQRFGLGKGKPKSLKAVGERLGITRERVRQLEASSLEKMRRYCIKIAPEYAILLQNDKNRMKG
ncbi:MAG: sigma-70 family RNA polymerase sigma factor [Zavarzinella sp.]